MGRPKKNSTKIDVDTASTEEVSRLVSDKLRYYGMIEFLLSVPSALRLLKSEFEVLIEIENKLEATLTRLKEKDNGITNKLLLGTIELTAMNLEIAKEKLAVVTKVLPQKIAGYEKFSAQIEEEPGLKEALERASQSHRKGDAALNEALTTISETLGGPTAVEKLFKKFPELTPSILPASFGVESIRKRIARQKPKRSNKN